MKKYLYSMLAMATMLFAASCSQEEDFRADGGNEVEALFTVELPAGVDTRAAGDGTTVDKVKCVVYEFFGDNKKEVLDELTAVVGIDGKTATYNTRLIKGRAYRVVFFAYNEAANAYNLSDMEAITFNAPINSNKENRDAFTAYVDVTASESLSAIKKPVTLKRPFAQLNVGSTAADTEAARKAAGVPAGTPVMSKSSIKVTGVYSTFDAFASVAKGATASMEFAMSEVLTEKLTVDGVDYTYAAMNYILAGEKTTTTVTFNWEDAEGNKSAENTVWDNVPLQRNYRTNILGSVLTNPAEFNITIDAEFKKPDDVIASSLPAEIDLSSAESRIVRLEDIDAATGTTIKGEGTLVLDNVTIKNAAGAAITLADGAKVTLQVLNKAHLEGATAGVVVPDGTQLTVVGANVVTRAGEVTKAGELTVVGNAGSGVQVGKALFTANGLAKFTAKGNGKHAFGIGGNEATVNIQNTTVDYVCGGYVQPLFENDLKYGKSEPEGGAAIGGLNINIDGSVITKADGGSKAAAIGAQYWQSTNIVINNSTVVEANGGNASAGIGGSRYADTISEDNKNVVTIRISNSTVTANGGQFAAGIGAGYDTHCKANDTNAVNDIVITNSTVNAKGGQYAAGIGTGYHSAALTGSIDGASVVNAVSGGSREKYTLAQNIGYGVVDATREFNGVTVTFTVAGEVIPTPSEKIYVADFDGLKEAMQSTRDIVIAGDVEITLTEDITFTNKVTVAAGANVTINLNGKTVAGTLHKSAGHVIKNEGTLTVKGGTVSSTAENGGSAIMNTGTLLVEDATLNGAKNAGGDWPSYTVNNIGTMTVNNTTITSHHGAVCSYSEGAVLTLNNSVIDMAGIPGFTNHGIYTYDGGKVVVNGGTYENKATDQNSTGGSVINGYVEVNAGTFSGRIEAYYGTPLLKGGTYSVNPTIYVADGYKAVDNGNGTYSVVLDVSEKIEGVTVTSTVTVDENTELGSFEYGDGNVQGLYFLNSKIEAETGVVAGKSMNVVLENTTVDCKTAFQQSCSDLVIVLDGCNIVVEDGDKFVAGNGILQIMISTSCTINGEPATVAAMRALCDNTGASISLF